MQLVLICPKLGSLGKTKQSKNRDKDLHRGTKSANEFIMKRTCSASLKNYCRDT